MTDTFSAGFPIPRSTTAHGKESQTLLARPNGIRGITPPPPEQFPGLFPFAGPVMNEPIGNLNRMYCTRTHCSLLPVLIQWFGGRSRNLSSKVVQLTEEQKGLDWQSQERGGFPRDMSESAGSTKDTPHQDISQSRRAGKQDSATRREPRRGPSSLIGERATSNPTSNQTYHKIRRMQTQPAGLG